MDGEGIRVKFISNGYALKRAVGELDMDFDEGVGIRLVTALGGDAHADYAVGRTAATGEPEQTPETVPKFASIPGDIQLTFGAKEKASSLGSLEGEARQELLSEVPNMNELVLDGGVLGAVSELNLEPADQRGERRTVLKALL